MEQNLEVLYSPSNWVLRVPADQAVPDHVKTVSAATNEAKVKLPHKTDVRYGRKEGQKLDIYGTDLLKGSPILVYLHGGYWQELSKDISAYLAIPLWEAGIKTIVGGYDLAPNETLKGIVQEIKELAVFALNMAKQEDCRNMWFCGHSAGGHLSASLVEAEWFNTLDPHLKQIFNGLILISGIYDLVPLVPTSINNPLHLTEESAFELSPMFKKEQIAPVKEIKALVVFAEHDSPAFHKQAKEYCEVLKSKNIDTTLMEVLGNYFDHFSIVSDLQYPSYVLTETIIKVIKQS